MLLVLIVGGWFGWLCRRARVQREAVAAIERAGGAVWFDWEWDEATSQERRQAEPGWLRRHLGPGFGEEVVQVRCTGADDSVMVNIGRLPRVRRIFLWGGGFTDAGMSELGKLRELQELKVSSPNVTSRGITSLGGLTRLERLSLDAPVEDAALVTLGGLASLQELSIDNAPITDQGLAHLSGLRSCRQLTLLGTKVSIKGIYALKWKCPWMVIDPWFDTFGGILHQPWPDQKRK